LDRRNERREKKKKNILKDIKALIMIFLILLENLDKINPTTLKKIINDYLSGSHFIYHM